MCSFTLCSWVKGCLLFSFLCYSGFAQVTSRNDTNPSGGSGGARGNHVIRGKIFLPSGRLPEVRMRVVLELVSGGIFSETFSDSVGGFEFRSLPNNTYRIIIPSDGQQYEKTEENLEVSGGVGRTFNSQMFLREKGSENRLRSSNKMVSAAELTRDIPKAAKKSYENGLKKMNEGKVEDALSLFQESLKAAPSYVQAINKIGEIQVGKQQVVEAEATFKRAASVNSKYPHTQVNLGMLMVQLKRYSEAIEYLDAANQLDESFPMAHLNLGVALLEKTPSREADIQRAENSFVKALALGGEPLAYVHKLLFNLHIRRQNYHQAIADLESYLKAVPTAPDAKQVQEMLGKVKKVAGSIPPK